MCANRHTYTCTHVCTRTHTHTHTHTRMGASCTHILGQYTHVLCEHCGHTVCAVCSVDIKAFVLRCTTLPKCTLWVFVCTVRMWSISLYEGLLVDTRRVHMSTVLLSTNSMQDTSLLRAVPTGPLNSDVCKLLLKIMPPL